MLESALDWIAWAGIVLPLTTLAASAWLYVGNERRKAEAESYNRFWEVMKQAGANDGNIASKMAAYFELRKYPGYRDVIVRLCEDAEVVGSSGPVAMLKREMLLTADYLRKTGPTNKSGL